MKQLSALALLVSSVAVANQSVTVTGTGNSIDEARRDAMHQASMRHCTTAIVNDREYRNEERSRNNLTAYSGCLVRDYTVVGQEQVAGTYTVTINADVVHSNLPSRIINNHPDTYFYDLMAHNDNVSQIRNRFKNGINLIDEVFYDFPGKAFNLQRSEYKISYEGNNSYLSVNWRATWNKNYVLALEEMLDILKDKPGSIWGSEGKIIKINKQYVFTDSAFPNRISGYLAMAPVTRLRVLDSNDREYVNVCQQWRLWFNVYDILGNNFAFNPRGYVEDPIKVMLPNNLPDDIKVEIDVVRNDYSFCRAFI